MKTFLNWLVEEEQKPDTFSGSFIPYLEAEEGWRDSVYKDTKGKPTVGYGFLVDPSFDTTLGTVFPNQPKEWRQGIASGSVKMTKDEGRAVLGHLGRQKFNQAREMVGGERFDAMSPELQTHLASEHYRGMLGKSPKALKLIQSGDYENASKEYLNARDFRENQKNSIGRRMQNLSTALSGEAKRLKPKQPVPAEEITEPETQ
jgi:hypothetical protein